MRVRFAAVAIMAIPAALLAQNKTPSDSGRAATDSASRRTVQLKPVVVTATPAERQQPMSAVTVPRTLLRETPAINPYDLLRLTAGIEVHDQGQGPGFASDASVRGFSSDHSTDMALWIDGVPINESVNGHAEGYNDWTLIFPEAVREIDVFKGPTNIFYGNFAMAGAVNVRTLERRTGTELSASGGAYGRFQGSLLTGFDHGSDGGVLGLRGQREDGWRPHSGYDLFQGHGRWVHDLSNRATLDAGLELYGSNWDSPGFITADQFDAGHFDTVANSTDGGFKRRAQERVSLRVHNGDESVFWRSTMFATQSRWELFLTTPPEGGEEEGSGAQTEEQDWRYGLGLTSAVDWTKGRTQLTGGVEGRFDHDRYENWQDSLRVRVDFQQLNHSQQVYGALFAQARQEIGPRLSVVLGARYDALQAESTPDAPAVGEQVTAGHGIFSPKLGAMYRLTSALSLFGNASRGFRSADGLNADPRLGFITGWNYETGIKVDNQRVTATASLFQLDVSNEQTIDPTNPDNVVNGGGSRRRGIDLDFAAAVSPWVSVRGTWTYTDAKYLQFAVDTGSAGNRAGFPIYNTSKYVSIAAVEVAPPGRPWYARVSGNAAGRYTPFDPEPAEAHYPAYGLLHIGGGVRLRDAMLDLGIRNLLDTRYAELRAGNFVSPGQPRSVYANLRYVF
jgi:outer membrane receptor protein involved in Fe transport